LAFAWQPRRYTKTGESDLARRSIDEDISWLDVLVDQLACMELTERDRQTDRNMQKRRQLPRLADELRKYLAARILHKKCRPPFVIFQRDGPSRPGGIQFIAQRICVLEACDALRRRFCRGECQLQVR